MKQEKKRINIFQPIKKSGLIAIARLYKHKGQYDIATIFFKKALDEKIRRSRPFRYYEYAYVLLENKNYKKALEEINHAIHKSKKNHSKYFVLRAQIYIKLKRYMNAEYDLHYAINIEDDNSLALYVLGVVLILQKKWHHAEEALLRAQKLGYASAKFYHRLGQVRFHMNRFAEAAEAFNQAARIWDSNVKSPLTVSELYYLAGLSCERDGNTDESHAFYTEALARDVQYNSGIFGIGVFHHIYKQYDLAIHAYAEIEGNEPIYRLAVLYDKLGETDQVIAAYKKVLHINQVSPKYHFKLGLSYETIGKYKKAAVCFRRAINRNNNHDTQWYVKLLHMLEKSGDTEEYKRVLHEATIVPDYANSVYRNGNNKMTRHARYNMFRNKLSLVPKTVLFESMSGNRVSGNPFAIFQFMLKDEQFQEYTFIWTVNSYDVIPHAYKHLPNVIFVIRYSDLFYKYLSAASYLVNNVTFPEFFMIKNGQKYLNTWHGTPWKTLGFDVKEARMDYANTARNFLHVTHFLFPNQYSYDRQMTSYQVNSLHTGKKAVTGYPRIDLTYKAMRNPQPMKEILGVDGTKKIILYAPTWRGEKAFQSFDKKTLKKDLNQLSRLDAHILFRGHHLAEDLLADIAIPNVTIVPPELDTNEILGITDILITDYSSVFFDFLVTDRPIIHYVYDYEAYTAERGLYFDLDELPGEVATTSEKMLEAVQKFINILYEPTEKYRHAKATYVYNDDGNVTKRVVDWFVHEKETVVDPLPERDTDKKKILFHAGSFQPNGITSAFINVINAMDKKHYDITIILSDSIIHHPERMEQLEQIQHDVNILPRTGQMYRDEEGYFSERAISKQLFTETTEQIYRNDYRNEYKRLFNKVAFDYIVDYSGYSLYYNQLLVSSANPQAKQTVFVHNDIYSEYINRYPQLHGIFAQYKQYDNILSVSNPTSELNKQRLSESFRIPESKFDYITNIQNAADVTEKSEFPMDDPSKENLFSNDMTVFITIGRLSGEKDQEKLIRAFEKVHQESPKTRLLIIGDGPLQYGLQSIITELGLQKYVHLLGRKKNPYPYLKRADCFILPSNYEGQPVVLFEALILHKMIIATDIVANRGVLAGGYGALCENTINGVVVAMNQYLAGELHSEPFDIEKYNQRAIEMLYEKVF